MSTAMSGSLKRSNGKPSGRSMFGKQADSRKETFAVHSVPESTRESRSKAFITDAHLRVRYVSICGNFAAVSYARFLMGDLKNGYLPKQRLPVASSGTCVNRRNTNRPMLSWSSA